MVRWSPGAFGHWASEIDRLRHARRGKNAYVERLIGSVRRECVDHVVVLGERHLRDLLLSYKTYYNETRTHLSLNKDAPTRRAVQATARILCLTILGGLHHQYGRI
jgi:transposase InsO family protein